MGIPFRPGPERCQRRHMGEIDRVQQRLADIGIGLARQRPEPGLHRVDALRHAGKPAPPDHALDGADLVLGYRCVFMPDHNRRRAVTERDMTGPKRL